LLNPGSKRLWRLYDVTGTATADVMSVDDEELEPGTDLRLHHHARSDLRRVVRSEQWSHAEELLVPVPDDGDRLTDVEAARRRRDADVDALDPGVRRLVNPHVYHVSITERLDRIKREQVDRFRG
jgi:nicotinate phosphoribosyltransferase